MADKKYRLKFGMSDGTEKSVEFTAPQGDKGDPGITPVVAVSDIAGGHRVTITTGNNVQTIDVLDGKNGDPGKTGITPAVSVTEIEGGHRVTITTGSDVQSFDVLDGKSGGTADAVAWKNVTGKPFNESLTGTAVVNGGTLSWDGNLDAMPIVVTPNNYNKWIYVSDNVPTMEQISAGHTLAFKAYNGSEININITPSESENYIYVGDMDGQYLYIIKKPCAVGNMVFERAGIYFYSDSKATIYTCRLTINGYTFTEMGGIKDAYIPQTIARKSDIPQECLPDNVTGSYVVKLPADTPVQVSQTSYGMNLTFVAAESYDNFAEVVYNGGNVTIDISSVDLSPYLISGIDYATVCPLMWNIINGYMHASGTTVFASGSNPILLSAVCAFPNGTWRPPTA